MQQLMTRTGMIFCLLIILAGGNASGFTLLSGDETTAPEENKAYAVENVFSLDFPKLLARDIGHVLASPLGWDEKDWLIFSVAAAGVAASGLLDKPVRSEALDIQNTQNKEVAAHLRELGGPYSFAALGLFFVGGEAFHDPVATAVSLDGAAATITASGIITPALKLAIGRARPYEEKGDLDFHPFSGNASFPSGETTQAFAVASVIASHYDDPWIEAGSYGIASLAGLARIYEDGHWASDVVAGGLIGATVGTAIVRFNDARRTDGQSGSNLFVAPLVIRKGGGLTIGLAL